MGYYLCSLGVFGVSQCFTFGEQTTVRRRVIGIRLVSVSREGLVKAEWAVAAECLLHPGLES